MDTVNIDGVEYVKQTGDGCIDCASQDNGRLCHALPNDCLVESGVFWLRKPVDKKQAELNAFFGMKQLTLPGIPEVTEQEDEAFAEMERKAHRQVGGDHYFNPIQPWDIIRAWDLNYWEGNIVKYVLRHKGKNKVEDLEKAKHYLDYLIEHYDELYPVSD